MFSVIFFQHIFLISQFLRSLIFLLSAFIFTSFHFFKRRKGKETTFLARFQDMGIRSFLARRKKSKSLASSLIESPIIVQLSSARTQLQELKQVFGRFDSNGDGKISWSELGSIMNSLGHPASEDELQSMVREVDSDGDGFIDLNEFIELNTTGVDSRAALEDLKNAFLIFDIDRNGSISPEELQTVLRSLGDDSSMAECRKMISGVDCDGDGLIDFEEFKIMMMRSVIPTTPTKIED